MKRVIFTIIAQNYLPQASVLVSSHHKANPNDICVVVFIDNQKTKITDADVYNASEVQTIPNLEDLSFKYNILEFSTSIKPFTARWLFNKYKAKTVLYIDPDICIYKSFEHIYNKLETHDCVLIPHITTPYTDQALPSEQEIFRAGLYNLGFGGFSHSKKSIDYLKWWENKLTDFCFSDPEHNMFTDQKWMDFAPSYLNTHIVKEPGYDVAYWNLHEYIDIIPTEDVIFYHFSGFDPNQNAVSKYQNRFTFDNIGKYRLLFEDYANRLASYTPKIKQKYVYPFNTFENKVVLTNEVRRIYQHLKTHEDLHFAKPFSVGKGSYFEFLNLPLGGGAAAGVTNFAYYFYQINDEVKQSFGLISFHEKTPQLNQYLKWLTSFGRYEYLIPAELLYPINPQLKLNKGAHHQDTKYLITITKDLVNQYAGEEFIHKAYRVFLKRRVDSKGLMVNLKDLHSGKANKYTVLYRIVNSDEFVQKWPQTKSLKVFKGYLAIRGGLPKYLPSKQNQRQILRSASKTPKGINLAGYLDTESGVGDSARGIYQAIKTAKVPANLINIEQPWLRRQYKKYNKLFSNKTNYNLSLLCVNADQTKEVLTNGITKDFALSKYLVGYWYWEGNIFPNKYLDAFEPLDEVWVATNYVYKCISPKTYRPILVIPPVIEKPIPNKKFNFEEYDLDISAKDYVFLNIFDSASFYERKNPLGLIEAFGKSFKNDSHTHLLIKTTNIKDIISLWHKVQSTLKEYPNVHLIDKYLSNQELENLLNRANAYVSLHRSEGLGIPLIQSMLIGKPTIATGFGGNVDFMNQKNSFLVNYSVEQLPQAIGPYPQGTEWAIPDTDHAATMMKMVKNGGKEIDKISKQGEIDTKTYFSKERIGLLIKERTGLIEQLLV